MNWNDITSTPQQLQAMPQYPAATGTGLPTTPLPLPARPTATVRNHVLLDNVPKKGQTDTAAWSGFSAPQATAYNTRSTNPGVPDQRRTPGLAGHPQRQQTPAATHRDTADKPRAKPSAAELYTRSLLTMPMQELHTTVANSAFAHPTAQALAALRARIKPSAADLHLRSLLAMPMQELLDIAMKPAVPSPAPEQPTAPDAPAARGAKHTSAQATGLPQVKRLKINHESQ